MQWADTHKFYQSHRVLISNIATSLSANRMTYWNLIEHWLRDSFSGWGKSLQVKVGSVSGANILPDFFHCQNTNPAQTKVKKNCWSTSYYFFLKKLTSFCSVTWILVSKEQILSAWVVTNILQFSADDCYLLT